MEVGSNENFFTLTDRALNQVEKKYVILISLVPYSDVPHCALLIKALETPFPNISSGV